MSPITPNFDPNAPGARLATDRYDFQAHITGANFRHDATQIDLAPHIFINGGTQTTVQQAIVALTNIVEPPSIPDATMSSKGIIQLSGDLGNTATDIRVLRIQGFPISPTSPVTGNVLTWNGTSWLPQAPAGLFTAGGDLTGNNTNQQVIGLTGTAGIINISGTQLKFTNTSIVPVIQQTINTSTSGNNMFVHAQSSSNNGSAGGDLVLTGGVGGTGGLLGGVYLNMGISTSTLLQLANPIAGKRILSLLNNGPLTITNMPANTGDMVIFIANANTNPTSGNPVGGTILYASGGKLFIKQSDGTNFAIGSLPNPFSYGPVAANPSNTTGVQVYNVTATSVTNAPVLAFTYGLPDNTSVRVEVTSIGKLIGSAESLINIDSFGFIRNGGAPITVPPNSPGPPPNDKNLETRGTTIAAASWVNITTNLSGNTLQIFTGYGNMGDNINWFLEIKISMVQA